MSKWVASFLRQCLPAYLLFFAADSTFARTWTSQDGRTIEAEFVRIHEEKVVLNWNGKVIQVPISSLSESDQQIAKDLASQGGAGQAGAKNGGGTSSQANSTFTGERAGRTNPFASEADGPRGILREWTDIQGRKIVAKFAGAEGESIVLDRDGKLSKVPFQRLSTIDQHYVYKSLNDMGMANNLPDVRDEGDSTGTIARDDKARAAKEQIASSAPSNNNLAEGNSQQPWTPRVWTYNTGRRITARLVTVQGANVVLSFRNKPLDVPFLSLSDDDRQYVRDRLTERGQLALLAEIDGQIAAANQPPPSFSAPPASPPTYSSAPPSPPSFNHDPFGASRRMEEDRQRRQQEMEQRRREMDERLAQMQRDRDERWRQMHTPPSSPATPPSPFAGSPPSPFPSSQQATYPPPSPPGSVPRPFDGYQCESCGRQMKAVPSDNKCPGCGIIFGRVQNEDGTYRETGAKGSFRFSFRSVKGLIALIGLVVAGVGALLRKIMD